MRFRLSIITLFRSPMKTLVTFVLLLATSFAFVSRGAEYATTVAEIEKAEAAYSAVGTLQRSTEGYYEYMENLIGEEVYQLENGGYVDRLSNATAPLDAEAVELVLSSGYLAQDEFFMVAGGLTHEHENVLEQPLYDIPNYAEWNWYRLGGTFEMDSAFVVTTLWNGLDYAIMTRGDHVTEVLVGNSEMYDNTKNYGIGYASESYTDGSISYHDQDQYFYGITVSPSGINNKARSFIPHIDYPAINLTELEAEYGISDPIAALQDPEKYGLVEFKNDYGFETVSTLEYMDTLYRNNHTVEMVHVSDMAKLSKFHDETMNIVDGREITSDDTGLVCVVSADYAEKNGLAVGDVIEFEVGADTMMHSGKVWSREPPYPAIEVYIDEHLKRAQRFATTASEQELTERGLDTVTQSYEIVGIWSDSNYEVSDPFSYSPNTVFVPMSTYPWQGEVEPTMLPSTFSFTLSHPGDMAKIEAELGDQLAAMGYELSINDMGYAEAKPSFEFMKLSALVGFVAMSLALVLSLILTVYLYIIRKKHDYAIMRALGTTRSRSNRSLLVGLFALAIPAVFLGSLLALALTQGFAADLSAQISEITGTTTASSMPAWLVGAFGAGVLGLLLVFARFGLVRVGRTPPLALLQGR